MRNVKLIWHTKELERKKIILGLLIKERNRERSRKEEKDEEEL